VSVAPRQRVRVPMPAKTPMTATDGTVSVPWLYYLMQMGRPLYEQVGWVLATCDPLTAGEDVSIRQPVSWPGQLAFALVVCKFPPEADGETATIDIKKSSDGAETWASIFEDGDENKIQVGPGDTTVGVVWGTFAGDKRLEIGDQVRLDVVSPGTGTMWVTVKLYWALDDVETTSELTPVGTGPGFYNFPEVVL
jgi:hypothetical protein